MTCDASTQSDFPSCFKSKYGQKLHLVTMCEGLRTAARHLERLELCKHCMKW